MKQLMQIDIATAVVKQIKDDKISMRSRSSFILERATKITATILLILIACISLASFVYSVNSQLFREYLEFGRAGLIRIGTDIPWLSLVIISAALLGSYLLLKNITSTYKSRLAISFALLLLVFGIGGVYGLKATNGSAVSKLANSYRLGVVPERVVGSVDEINSGYIVVKTSTGSKKVLISNDTLFKGEHPQVGDSVVILVNTKDNQFNAEAVKIIDKIQKPASSQIETPKPVEPLQEQPKIEQPSAPVVTTKPSTSTGTTTPTPAATPAPVEDMTINIYNSGAMFKWKTTYTYDGGYKLVWSKNPYPTYPGRNAQDTYYYNSNPVANPQVYTISAFDGAGLYYVRVCGLDAVHNCIKYSAQLTATLP